MATVPELAAEYRSKLLKQESAARAQMLAEWRKASSSIEADAKALASQAARRGVATPNEVYRMERYASFMSQTQGEIAAYTADAQAKTAALVGRAAQTGHAAAAAMTGVVGLAQNPAAVEQMVARIVAGAAAQRFRTIPVEVAGQVADALIAGISKGQHPTRTARQIRRVADTTSYQAQRIARTETLTAYRDSQIGAWKGSGVVQGWKWDAALDDRTCPVCWGMHGQIFPADEPFETHANCRCSPVPMTMTAEEAAAQGWDMRTGDQAFASLSAERQQSILGPGRYEAYSQGIPLSAMVVRTSNPVWGGSRAALPVRDLAGL